MDELLDNESRRKECLWDVLSCEEAAPSKAHEHVATIPFRAYLTTNYDQLIEDAHFKLGKGKLPRHTGADLALAQSDYAGGVPFILKLHGDIDAATSIILGDRAYERLEHQTPAYHSCLYTFFTTSSVLFVGFGGRDPDLEGLLGKVALFTERRRRRWLLVPEGHFPPLKAKRLYKDKGIVVVEYPHKSDDVSHTGLVSFLAELAAKCAPDVPVKPPSSSGAVPGQTPLIPLRRFRRR